MPRCVDNIACHTDAMCVFVAVLQTVTCFSCALTCTKLAVSSVLMRVVCPIRSRVSLLQTTAAAHRYVVYGIPCNDTPLVSTPTPVKNARQAVFVATLAITDRFSKFFAHTIYEIQKSRLLKISLYPKRATKLC